MPSLKPDERLKLSSLYAGCSSVAVMVKLLTRMLPSASSSLLKMISASMSAEKTEEPKVWLRCVASGEK